MIHHEAIKILRLLSVLHAPPGKPFVLKSGKESLVYIDVRRAALDPHGLRVLSSRLFWIMSGSGHGIPSKVAGVALGGCPLATGVSLAALTASEQRGPDGALVHDCLPVPGTLYVRPEPKAHGTGKLIEGVFEPGESVVLVEDVTTTGGSSLRALQALREAGLVPQGVVTVLDREEGARAAIEAEGVYFKTLCTLSALLGKEG